MDYSLCDCELSDHECEPLFPIQYADKEPPIQLLSTVFTILPSDLIRMHSDSTCSLVSSWGHSCAGSVCGVTLRDQCAV